MKLKRLALLVAAAALVYLVSPLTVWFAVGIVPVVVWGTRDLEPDERRLVTSVLVIAIALRLLVVLGLFLASVHSQQPFGSFFGDEDYFIKRSLWLRNLALGRPLHRLDLEYAFEPFGSSRYLYLLALIQLLVGPSPYGLHLVSVFFYTIAVLVLYLLIRPTFGRMPALFGFTVLLFLPSLFMWSVSVLKEPLFVLVSSLSLVCAIHLVRAPSPGRRIWALVGFIALAAVLEGIRSHGAVFAFAGVLGGLTIGAIAVRPRLLVASLIVTPILVGVIVSRPTVQLKAYVALQNAAREHWGMVVGASGRAYRLLDDRFYADVNEISDLRGSEALRFLGRGVAAYVLVPLPWMAESRAAVAYLPEQMMWYLLVALAGVGVLFAFRYDALVAGLLVGHSMAIAAAVAFTTGNVGTLVRHRDLILPYLVWLSGVGACELLRAMQPTADPIRPGRRATWSAAPMRSA